MQSPRDEEVAADHGQESRPDAPSQLRLTAPGQGTFHPEISKEEEKEPNEQPRPTTTEEKIPEEETAASRDLPENIELVTVEEAVILFKEGGLPRHIRTIQKYCAKVSGRALVCHQTPTENGIRYLIEKSSIDRFIKDATHQAPIGETEKFSIEHPQKEPQPEPSTQSSTFDIFDHPYVQKLESQVTNLSKDKDNLQKEIQNILVQANERLVELQKASAVAQSETLGAFLLETERIRQGQKPSEQANVETEFPSV